MAETTDIRILVEGGLDYFLLKDFINVPKRNIKKVSGFGNIKKDFKNSCKTKRLIGIVDEDDGKIINIHFKSLNPVKYKQIDRFEIYKISKCYLIVLHKPEIEDWIAKAVDIKKFGFKDIKDFKQKSKTDKVLSKPDKKIEQLLTEFTKTDSFKLLKNFLLQLGIILEF